MIKYQWKHIRLYGRHWWSAPDRTAPAEEDKAAKQKEESEQRLTDLLNDGWQIISVVPQATNGSVRRTYLGAVDLLQEVWVVFVQRPVDELDRPPSF